MYQLAFTCVGVPRKDVPALEDMIDRAITITPRTFRKNAGSDNYQELEQLLGYPCGDLRLANDYTVSFHRSQYKKRRVYYVRHSSIEYVFLPEREV